MTTDFHWDLPDLDQPRFVAFTNLLLCRTGRQLEYENPDDDDECMDDLGELSDNIHDLAGAIQPRSLTNDGGQVLKRRFLDRFAELASPRKGPADVACAVMKESEENVSVWVSRNEGFTGPDFDFFRQFTKLMKDVSDKAQSRRLHRLFGNLDNGPSVAKHQLPPATAELWDLMVEYYTPRILHYAAHLKRYSHQLSRPSQIRSAFPTIRAKDDPLTLMLLSLSELVSSSFGHHIGLSSIVLEAYKVQQLPDSERRISQRMGNVAGEVWTAIRFLSRLKSAHITFIEAATELRCFQSIAVTPIQKPGSSVSNGFTPLTLTQTFGRLGKQWNSAIVQLLVRSIPEARFSDLQQQSLFTHAEIQMVIFLAQKGIAPEELVNYMGCSKLSCFLCRTFLDKYRAFKTRGCHKRLYTRWTVPPTHQLPSTTVGRLVNAIRGVEEEVKKNLLSLSSTRRSRKDVAESSVGTIIAGRTESSDDDSDGTVEAALEFALQGLHLEAADPSPIVADPIYSDQDEVKTASSADGRLPDVPRRRSTLGTEPISQERLGQQDTNISDTWDGPVRALLDDADIDKSPKSLLPEAKRRSYHLYVCILRGCQPNPSEKFWYQFGFATCRDEAQERALGALYHKLIGREDSYRPAADPPATHRCTFAEFWNAYNRGKLIRLIDSKGLAEDREALGNLHLERFLSAPDHQPSVWLLKVLLRMTDETEVKEQLLVDYGFQFCTTPTDTLDLKAVYRTVLQYADPLDLHEACIVGELFSFCSAYTALSDRMQDFLKNPYPLPNSSCISLASIN